MAGKEREHNLQSGDNVEVCEGELINLQGKILSVDGNKITIMPKHEDLKVSTCLHSTSFFLCHVPFTVLYEISAFLLGPSRVSSS